MRQLVIGDIHGNILMLDALLDMLELASQDELIFLGDYVDKGPDSSVVLDRLIDIKARHKNATFIRGNHDQLMLSAQIDEMELHIWETLGGRATLDSYEPSSIDGIPQSHWSFLESTVDYFETKHAIFVHAHLKPDLPLEKQDRETMHWLSLDAAQAHESGKVVICGHSPQTSGIPAHLGHTICVDTKNWLTALDLQSLTYTQVNEAGQNRHGNLASPDSI